MKPQVRVVGIDDAPFKFSEERVLVVGAVVRLPNYLEGVMRTEIGIDGTDSTTQLVTMLNNSRYKDQLELVMLDGIAFGGFNIIDLDKVFQETGIPVCSITRDEPDMDSIKKALKQKFKDWQVRWKLIVKAKLVELETQHKPVHVGYSGLKLEDLKLLVKRTTVRGALPEPIRIAHLIASAMKTGESYGRA